MSILDTMRQRYSVRSYQARPVEPEKLAQILEAAHIAPTAANRQPQRIVVVQSPEQVAKFRTLCRFRESPVVLIICAVKSEAWVRASDGFNAAVVDATIITDHMMLAATELGLGSLWMSSFDVPGVSKAFDLPADWEPIQLLCLGYAEGQAPSTTRFAEVRKPLSATVFWK